MSRAWLTSSVMLGLMACGPRNPTELMIDIVSVDLQPGTSLLSVQVQAYREGTTNDLLGGHPPFALTGPGRFTLPGHIAIVTDTPDDPRRVTIIVTAQTAAGSITLSYAQAFVPGTVTHVVFPLASRCAEVGLPPCADGTICGPNGCATPTVFPGDGGTANGCVAPTTACVDGCFDLERDDNHCGSCETRCGATELCAAGSCQLSPTCEVPTPIVLDPVTTLHGHVSFDVSHDTVGCGSGPQADNAYVTFTLATPEIVALETDPSDPTVRVGFVDSCTTATCSTDSGCGTPYFERLVQVRPAGPQVVVASQTGVNSQQWTFTIRHVPVPSSATAGGVDFLPSGAFSRTGTTTGAAALPSGCDLGASVVDHAYWFLTCPGATTATLTASTCGAGSTSTGLELWNDTAMACVVGASCSGGSTLSADVTTSPGLHVLYVTSTSAASGSYTLMGSVP